MKIKDITTFGIIGGDKRQLFLADSLISSGYNVLLGGFDKLESTGHIVITDVGTAIQKSDIIILPLPCLRTDGSLNTPFSDNHILFSDKEIDIINSKPVFAGIKSKILKKYPRLSGDEIYDYAEREDFAVMNAVPSAEGAIETAMRNFEGTIAGSKCLITGSGRIGRILADMLKKLNADVTVSARNTKDLAYIKAFGCKAINTKNLTSAKGYDIIFNTIPSMIFDIELLMSTDKGTIIIDLASLPGGVNFEAAKMLGINTIRALSLPGRCSPKTAGEIIKTTIFNIIKEVYG